MSVAELLSLNAALGNVPLALVLAVEIITTGVAIRGGMRWVSQPSLTLAARRLVRSVVFTGWGVMFAFTLMTLAIPLWRSSSSTAMQSTRDAPSMRTVPYEPPATDQRDRAQAL